ncbi:MFS transporter [Piscinibacter gummiphilus]|uniref:MFS transporter n=1 Tax=Piscinibacter gummiphilus TaxID=946333 RepID=A0A1W6L9L7_9BURK|nr:MFS transporter [Piscinibacter gummiphilus]ARN20894.1 MFS transporter [Piscinibacter gummiphilus]ATU65570.1 MFS transporter [Piscinibacter gummiphilus]GLS94736.1 MFS transporter [Piscinibacter gummiphilus]
MLAVRLSAFLQRRGIHYAWAIAAITFLAMLVTSAALGLPGALMQPLSREFGWSTTELSSIFAVRFALYGLLGPFAAVVLMRYGVSRVVALAAGVIATSLLLGQFMHSLGQAFALWGLTLGIGTGLTAMVLGAMVANRWFVQRKGLVMGLLAGSSATGQLVFLPLAAWLIEQYGWRWALVPVVAASVLVLVLVLLFMRDTPAALGLAPYGAAPDAPPAPSAPRPDWALPFRTLASAARVPTFWVLAGTFFICGLSTNGLVQTHFISLCADRGLGPVPAASVLSMMGIFDLVGTTLSGYLSDRFDNRKLLFWYYGLRGLSLFWLPHSDFTLMGLSLFAMFYGLDWIATVPPTVKLAAAEFGPERASVVFGWVFAAHQLGAATATYGAGLSRSILASYDPAVYAAGAACLLAATAVLLIRGRQRDPVVLAAKQA